MIRRKIFTDGNRIRDLLINYENTNDVYRIHNSHDLNKPCTFWSESFSWFKIILKKISPKFLKCLKDSHLLFPIRITWNLTLSFFFFFQKRITL